jgi:hypothetical protein
MIDRDVEGNRIKTDPSYERPMVEGWFSVGTNFLVLSNSRVVTAIPSTYVWA